MKIAIISDIHANLEALTAVLEDIEKKEDVKDIICLGDIVGYGANPNECVEIIKNRCSKVVLGNHDAAGLGLISLEYFNIYARAAAIWTQNQLTEESRKYLKNLEYVNYLDEKERIMMVHSSPLFPENWNYILNNDDAKTAFYKITEEIACFIGHSHQPIIFSKDISDSVNMHPPKDFTFDENKRYFINVGSVGQPRDGIKDSSYVIFDLDKLMVFFQRVPYDVEQAAQKIRDAELSDVLADRLLFGR
ncbi:MAG: metallophosphoesterase family protein [bacterium]|nr:metallophosphoesterase family protein [bacterium]